MPNKLTDTEIKKALEEYVSYLGEDKHLHYSTVKAEVLISALDLINRQEEDCEKYKQVAEYQQSVTMDRGFEIKRLKAEVERLKKVEERHMRLYHLLLDPLIVANGKNGELRPIKRTSRQDVYHTLLRAQEIMKIPHRWFPWKRDGDNK